MSAASDLPAVDDPHLSLTGRTIDDVAVVDVVLDRPEKLNALPAASLDALVEAVDELSAATADVVVLTGAAGDFCVGVDVTELADAEAGDHAAAADRMHRLVDALRSCPLPVVAAVPGRAFGAGFLACMAADVVVADADASFGLQEVSLGIPVAGYATAILPRLVGEHRAREWLFSGRTVDAREAEQAGFVAAVATDRDLDALVTEQVRALGAGSSTAIALLKARMAAPTPDDGPTMRERESRDIETAFETGDAAARVRDLLE